MADLTKDQLYARYGILRMEAKITADEIKSKVAKSKLSVADYVARLKAQGMSKTDIQKLLVTDLKTGGPLFSELRASFSSPFSAATSRISSTIANYEAAGGEADEKMVWIASFKNTCSSCIPRHGVKKTYAEWVKVGLPGNFGSFCNGYCQCRLYPVDYPGVAEMVKPNNRKQWKKIQASGGKVADPADLPGSLVQSERLLAKQQREVAKKIEAMQEQARAIEKEILFVDAMNRFDGKKIKAKSRAERQKILDLFAKYGITEVNSLEVEKVVVVS